MKRYECVKKFTEHAYASYYLDLRKPHKIVGCSSYFVHTRRVRGQEQLEILDNQSFIINAPLAATWSNKLVPGIKVVATIRFESGTPDSKCIGYAEKLRDRFEVYMCLPRDAGEHMFLTLMLTHIEMITFHGTDLYRRKAKINSVHLSEKYDDD
jgi:hypothetical protein